MAEKSLPSSFVTTAETEYQDEIVNIGQVIATDSSLSVSAYVAPIVPENLEQLAEITPYILPVGVGVPPLDITQEPGVISGSSENIQGTLARTVPAIYEFTSLNEATQFYIQWKGTGPNNVEKLSTLQIGTTLAQGETSQAEDDTIETLADENVSGTPNVRRLRGYYHQGTIHGDELETVGFYVLQGDHTAEDNLSNAGATIEGTSSADQSVDGQVFDHIKSGLTPNVLYSYQAVGRRTSDAPWEIVGRVLTFSTALEGTAPQDDTVTTLPVSQSGETSATLEGHWFQGTPYGDELEEFTFFYKEGDHTGTNLDTGTEGVDYQAVATTPGIDGRASETVIGLNPGTQYSVQFYGKRVSNQPWQAYGDVETFTTQNQVVSPIVATTGTATEVDHDSANMVATLENISSGDVEVTYFFRYGDGFSAQDDEITNPVDTAPVTITIPGAPDVGSLVIVEEDTGDVLDPVTPYIYRLVYTVGS